MIYIIDFGSQTCHLIGRRVRDLGSLIKIISPENALAEIQENKPEGIILSGGPSSVYEPGAPTIDKKIFSLGRKKLRKLKISMIFKFFKIHPLKIFVLFARSPKYYLNRVIKQVYKH